MRSSGHDSVERRLRHGRRAINDPPQPAQLRCVEFGRIQNSLDHRGHQQCVGDISVADQVERGIRVKSALHDGGSASEHDPGQPGCRGQMEQRCDDQHATTVWANSQIAHRHPVGDKSGMAEDDPFGPSRGAAGVKDRPRRNASAFYRRQRCLSQKIAPIEPPVTTLT